MPTVCQGLPPIGSADGPVVVVAGAAGSGKTTLGRALACSLRLPVLDLDTLTNPLLDRLDAFIDGSHWNSAGPHRDIIRDGRYAVLRSAAQDLVAVGQRAVLIAPFTRELAAGPAWNELVAALAPAPVAVVYLSGSPELLARRREQRQESRDEHREPDRPASPPQVAHLLVDAALTTDEQIVLVRDHYAT